MAPFEVTPLKIGPTMNAFRALLLPTVAVLALRSLVRTNPRLHALPDRAINDRPEAHSDQLNTYQALLDESLQLAFPASDPVCTHAATRCARACETPANEVDWQLRPGSTSNRTAVDCA